MAHKKSYSRYFIILQEDEKGCALAQDKQPSGYTKIEIKNNKCKVSYYIQNLKRDKDPYHMVLICNKKDVNKLVNIGVLNIDDNGRADISYEFNIDNIGGTGIATDKIGGAAIIRNVDKRLIVPMSGFASTDIPNGWKNYALIEASQKREEQEEKVEEIEDTSSKDNKEETKEVDMPTEKEPTLEVSNLKEEPEEEMREEPKPEEERKDEAEKIENNIFEEYEKIIDEAKDKVASKEEKILKEDIRQEEDREDIKEPKEKTEEVEEEVESKPEETREAQQEKVEEVKEEFNNKDIENIESYLEQSSNIEGRKTFNFEDNSGHVETEYSNQFEHIEEEYRNHEEYPLGSVGEFFESIAEGFEETRAIFPELKKCKWYRVPVRHLDDMFNMSNYNKYTVIYYPMINYYPYIKKYGHYMLGYKCDEQGKMKYIVYAIPGTKEKVEQPYGGKSGFVTWVPDKKDEKSKYGYWLMFYDFRNSMVVVPMR